MKFMIKKQLEDLMERNQIKTISDLANRTKIAKSVLHGYLQDSEPSLKNLVKLCEYFEISLDQILGRNKYQEVLTQKIMSDKSLEYIITIKAKDRE